MPTLLRKLCFSLGILSAAIAMSGGSVLHAQPTSPAGPITSRFVPNDALAMAIVSPAELMDSPQLSMFPIEVFRAQSLDMVGIDIADVATVMIVAGVPVPPGLGQPGLGQSGPPAALIVKLTKDYKISDLNPKFLATGAPEKIGKYEVYALNDPPQTYIHVVDARTFVVAPEFYLETVIEADKGTGALPKLVESMPRNPGVTIVAVIEPIRPMLAGYVKQQVAPQLPPPLRSLGQVPEWVDAVLLNSTPSDAGLDLKLSMLCGDETKAEKLEATLNHSLQFGIEMANAQLPAAVAGESERVQQAAAQYAARLSAGVAEMLKPTRTGRRVSLTMESDAGIASAGVMVGLLLPAVQAAREAARRMSASNGLKQIMLAMHNYHAAYNRLPAPAITNDDGEPLLSWRVSLLPFVEEQALYQQFHLDEPWDSPHNLPLSEKLPSVYMDPSAPLPPGYTVFHAVVGEEIGLRPVDDTGFNDFTDGLANSILIFEASQDAAIPWSKPEDVEIDLDDPLAVMGDSHQGGFHVGIADGSIKFITDNIDLELFRALLTRAGGEPIDVP